MRTRVALVSTLALALGVGSSAQAYSALMLEGNISLAEYPEMSKINMIGNFTFDWEKTADRNLADLDDVDILWSNYSAGPVRTGMKGLPTRAS
jgi:hypothetical protein